MKEEEMVTMRLTSEGRGICSADEKDLIKLDCYLFPLSIANFFPFNENNIF